MIKSAFICYLLIASGGALAGEQTNQKLCADVSSMIVTAMHEYRVLLGYKELSQVPNYWESFCAKKEDSIGCQLWRQMLVTYLYCDNEKTAKENPISVQKKLCKSIDTVAHCVLDTQVKYKNKTKAEIITGWRDSCNQAPQTEAEQNIWQCKFWIGLTDLTDICKVK